MRGKIPQLSLAIAVLAGAGGALVPQARAEEGVAATPGVEEIVVTARRREESMQNVPIAVSALSAEQLEKRQILEIRDIARDVPNLQLLPVTGNAVGIQVFMRGAAVENPGLNTSESPVGLYEDDVYRGRLGAASLDLSDIERVEVLRGPQATLYGRNTLAGAIKLYSRIPGDKPWLNGSVAYGNWNTTQVKVSGGGPLVADNLAASLALLFDNRDKGYYVNELPALAGRDVGRYTNYSGRAKLHWYGSERADLVAQFEFVKGDNDGYNGIAHWPNSATAPLATLAAAPRVAESFYGLVSPYRAFGKFEQRSGSLNFRYNLTDEVTFKSITGYFNGHDDTGLDFTGGSFDAAGKATGAPGLVNNTFGRIEQWTQELQLLGTAFDSRLNWLTGLYYLRESGTQLFPFFKIPLAGPTLTLFTESQATRTNSYAGFGQMTYALTPIVSLTAGARYTRDDKRYSDLCVGLPFLCVFSAGGFNPTGTWSVAQNRSFSHTDWKLGVDFQLSERLLAYASATTGFKAGGFQTLCFGNQACVLQSYSPESVISYEVGFKKQWFGNRLRVNGAAFDAEYQDLQSLVVQSFGSETANIGKQTVRGTELEVNAAVTRDWNIFMSTGTAWGSYGTVALNSVVVLDSARSVPGLPVWNGDLGFGYDHPVSFLSARVLLGADVLHSASYFNDASDALRINGYNRLNAHIGLAAQDDRWSLTLAARNVTDQKNVAEAVIGSGANMRLVLPPREWLITFKTSLF